MLVGWTSAATGSACAVAALFMISRALGQAASAPPLKPFVQEIPGAAAQVAMIPVPAGTVTVPAVGGKGQGVAVRVKPFWIAKTETTWEVLDAFTNSGPPSPAYDQTKFAPDAIARPSKSYIPPDMGWGHHGFPVINESFLNAQMFCRWLSARTGRKYRLPTEAEWEYAARAGAAGPWKPSAAELARIAWYAGDTDQTHPVGKKLPNAWGLYDMYGNVGEWATDLAGKPVQCGGSYADKPPHIGPDARAYFTPDWQATDPQIPKSRWWLSDAHFAGFRIVCEP